MGMMCLACKKRLNDDILPMHINDTNIFLVPKCDQPSSMKDLDPSHYVMSFIKFFPRLFQIDWPR